MLVPFFVLNFAPIRSIQGEWVFLKYDKIEEIIHLFNKESKNGK